MNPNQSLHSKYSSSGILVDSNLLLLLLVGLYRRSLVGSFKRLEQFSVSDFELLKRALSGFRAVVTTPMILAEVNSLSNALSSKHKRDYYAVFGDVVQDLREETLQSKEIVATETFKRFGYTDAAIEAVAKQRFLILTDDFALTGYLATRSVDVINFNHLRYA